MYELWAKEVSTVELLYIQRNMVGFEFDDYFYFRVIVESSNVDSSLLTSLPSCPSSEPAQDTIVCPRCLQLKNSARRLRVLQKCIWLLFNFRSGFSQEQLPSI